MSAKIILLIKDSCFYSKMLSVSMWERAFHPIKSTKALYSKYRVLVSIDEKELQVFEASKKPYEFVVNEGHHIVVALDPGKDSKQSQWKIFGFVTGAMTGLGMGSNLSTALIGGESGSNFVSDLISAGASTMEFDLAKGDVIKIQCKATMTGKVKMNIV